MVPYKIKYRLIEQLFACKKQILENIRFHHFTHPDLNGYSGTVGFVDSIICSSFDEKLDLNE